MDDLKTMHEEIRRIREDTNADRDVRESLQSIERALGEMASTEGSADPGELNEVRAKIDRLADNAEGQTAVELDRLREEVREFERDSA